MAFSISSPVTGATISGLTTPTVTYSVDTPPDVNAKQYAATALGGTQPGVVTHSPELPFTMTFKRPKTLKTLGAKNASTGFYLVVPKNEYALIGRKGVTLATNQYDTITFDLRIRVPAGTGTLSPNDARAGFSAFTGVLTQNAQGIVDTMISGIA